MGVVLVSTGKALPKTVVDNYKLATMVDTNNDWIVERTGIEKRNISTVEMGVDLAAAAGRKALEAGNVDKATIDLVIAATATPDKVVPSMGALIKKEMNLPNAIAFDINTACSGFIYAMWMADAMLKNAMMPKAKTNTMRRALVVGVERLSRIVDWEDRGTCVIFGDGAGAAVLEYTEDQVGIISSYVKNYDDIHDSLSCGIEYRKTPFTEEVSETMLLKMNGTKVFRFAVTAIGEVMDKALEYAELSPDDIKFYVPHQANRRIINAAAQRYNQPLEKFQISIEETGNVSAASVPMALDDAIKSGKIQKGDKIMLVGFGGGLSAGAIILEY